MCAIPSPGFLISSSGMLAFNGSFNFVGCHIGENSGVNILSVEPFDLGISSNIKLKAYSCFALAPASPLALAVPNKQP